MRERTLQTTIRTPLTDLEREIAELSPWFHNLHLPDGTQTSPDHPLGDFPRFKWRQLARALPHDLSGWRALDIGCNAGFYSIELARRGARVTAIDVDPRYLRQAEWATRRFGINGNIEFKQMQVYDLAREPGVYDLVLFMGVFYHLRYPLLALDAVCRKAGRLLAFQSLTHPGRKYGRVPSNLKISERKRMMRADWPKMAFIEKEFEGDGTNWWVPNQACIEAMLRTCGMKVIARPGHEMVICRPDEKLMHSRQENEAEFNSARGQ